MAPTNSIAFHEVWGVPLRDSLSETLRRTPVLQNSEMLSGLVTYTQACSGHVEMTMKMSVQLKVNMTLPAVVH